MLRSALATAAVQRRTAESEMLRELSAAISRVQELAAPLKAMGVAGAKPSLQLMFYNAAALAQGMLCCARCLIANPNTIPCCARRGV